MSRLFFFGSSSIFGEYLTLLPEWSESSKQKKTVAVLNDMDKQKTEWESDQIRTVCIFLVQLTLRYVSYSSLLSLFISIESESNSSRAE